jgi:hypothetical protein
MLVDSFPLIPRIGWKGKVPSITHNAPLIRFNSHLAARGSNVLFSPAYQHTHLAAQSASIMLVQLQCQVESTPWFRPNRLS